MSFKHGELVDFYTWKDKERLDVNKHNGKIVRRSPYIVVLDLDTNKKYKFDYKGNSLKDGEQRMVYKVGEYFIRLTTVQHGKITDGQGFSYWNFSDITLPPVDYSFIGDSAVVNTHNQTYTVIPDSYNQNIVVNLADRMDIISEALQVGLITQDDAALRNFRRRRSE